MTHKYYCRGCKKTLEINQYIEGMLHCPFCGSGYDVLIMKGNTLQHVRQKYIASRKIFFGIALFLIWIVVSVCLVLLSDPSKNGLIYISFLLLMIFLLPLDTIMKNRAKKIFPD